MIGKHGINLLVEWCLERIKYRIIYEDGLFFIYEAGKVAAYCSRLHFGRNLEYLALVFAKVCGN